MSKPEYILCAAIWYKDGVQHYSQPYNVPTGIVMCGLRHVCIHEQIRALTGDVDESKIVPGFLTSHNKFVNRFGAYSIAKNAGQLLQEDSTDSRELMSDDIF